MGISKSILRLNRFLIEETIFIRNDLIVNEYDLKFNIRSKVILSKEEDKAELRLTCTLFDEEFDHSRAPFYLKVTIAGHFECMNLNKENFEKYALAIQLPYLRAFITSFTFRSGIHGVTIPPTDLVTFLKKS
ncbi:hypothetical protein V7056_14555 [Bacillus sp. JJ664]